MWKGRFAEDTDARVQAFTQSLDLDWRLAAADLRGSVAHVRMLGTVGLLSSEEARTLEEHLKGVGEEIRSGALTPRAELEDVHMTIEARLTERCGPLGARLHMGRSRNDQVATALRLHLRSTLLTLQDALDELLSTLLERARTHAEALVPGYTHLQQAQPVSLGHYWMAHFWAFLRDDKRFAAAYDAADECPLGSGALAGSTLPLDRAFVARDLGFSRITDNSMDSVASRDYLLDALYAAASFGLHASRLAEDLILYASTEFGWIRLPDAFCTGSSMMPQKKNPDVLELIRGKTGQFVGHLVDLMTTTKGLPLTYNRDLQEDKRGLWASLDTAAAVLGVLPPLLARVEVDEVRAREAFQDGYLLSTDVAEFLVRRGVPFRTAHEQVGRAVRWCLEHHRPLQSLSLEEWQRLIPEVSEELLPLLTPEAAVRRRTTLGGTAPESVQRQILQGQELLAHRRMKRERRWETLPRELVLRESPRATEPKTR